MTNYATLIVKDIKPYGRKIVGDVEVTVDLNMIASNIGWRALTNKSGKSKFMQGAIVVKALNKRTTD